MRGVSKFCISILVLSLGISASHTYKRPLRKRTCGTADPSANLTSTHQWLHRNEEKPNSLWNGAMIQRHVHSRRQHFKRTLNLNLHNTHNHERRQENTALFTIDTYIHVVTDTANANATSAHFVKDSQLQQQIAYLNSTYASVGIAYRLINTTRTVNDTWAKNGDDLAMKRALRKGTYSTLNIYYQTLLQENDPNIPPPSPNSFLLGFCTLPIAGITTKTPRETYVTDGCNILSGTLPGSWQKNYNLGGTTTHEVGHWNGLLHTFQGYTCDSADWGDYIADTPQEAAPTRCPVNKDTCPDSGVNQTYDGSGGQNPFGPQGYAGLDPVSNFMDYSIDSCYAGFTPGQGARMVNLWTIYRLGK